MNITTVILEAEKNVNKNARDIERLAQQITAAVHSERFPATNHLKALAVARIEHGLWKVAIEQLQRLEPNANVVKASQLLRQIADSALSNVLLPGDSTDGFTRAQMAAEREGYSNFYREAVATADYINSEQ